MKSMLNITIALVEYPPLLSIDPDDNHKLVGLGGEGVNKEYNSAKIW